VYGISRTLVMDYGEPPTGVGGEGTGAPTGAPVRGPLIGNGRWPQRDTYRCPGDPSRLPACWQQWSRGTSLYRGYHAACEEKPGGAPAPAFHRNAAGLP